MKKIFTLLAVCMMAITANAAITIYVNSEQTPYIWWWDLPAGQNSADLAAWPGNFTFQGPIQHESGLEFWTYTFPEDVTKVSFLINDGAESGTQQTKDVTGVTTDRYFMWDGAKELIDITAEITGQELPDAEVDKVSLSGNHNGWVGDTDWFTVVEAGKKFQLIVDASAEGFADENLWQFKFRPNGQEWVGYWDVYYNDAEESDPEDGRAPKSSAPSWLTTPEEGGNFQIDLEADTRETKTYTITVTWGGGKEAGKNWAFEISGPTSGISTVKALNTASNAPIYNLQGQRVNDSFRGIAIQNGRKVVVK